MDVCEGTAISFDHEKFNIVTLVGFIVCRFGETLPARREKRPPGFPGGLMIFTNRFFFRSGDHDAKSGEQFGTGRE